MLQGAGGNQVLGKFVQIAQRTQKTCPTAKYASVTSPKNTLKGTVFKNIAKYPKLTRLLVDYISLRSPSYSLQ